MTEREPTPEAKNAILAMSMRVTRLAADVVPVTVPCDERIGIAAVSALMMGMRLALYNRAYAKELLEQAGDERTSHMQGIIDWIDAHPLKKGQRGPLANGDGGPALEAVVPCGFQWEGIDRQHQCVLPQHSPQHDHICGCTAKLIAERS